MGECERTWWENGLFLVLLQELVRLGLEGTGGVPEGGPAALVADANLEPMRVHVARVLLKTGEGKEL